MTPPCPFTSPRAVPASPLSVSPRPSANTAARCTAYSAAHSRPWSARCGRCRSGRRASARGSRRCTKGCGSTAWAGTSATGRITAGNSEPWLCGRSQRKRAPARSAGRRCRCTFVIHLDRHAARVHVHCRDDAQITVVRADTGLGPGTLKRDVVVILDLHDFIAQT